MGAVGRCVAIGEEVGKEVIELLARGEITVVAFGANGVNERGDGDKATSEGGVLRQGLHFFSYPRCQSLHWWLVLQSDALLFRQSRDIVHSRPRVGA